MSSSIAEELLNALEQITHPGSFCASGSGPVVLPGLTIEGLGPVGLPLTETQAGELKDLCHLAPYGKGEQTLVDPDVRQVWRLTPDLFKLTNPEWEDFLKQTVGKVQEELGLEKQKLATHLYDLLLYEKGSFFLPHQDGEKLDRMVATLVIVLPSAHEGGELIVRHDGQEKTIAFGGPESAFRLQFAAFYADCEHEVRPVTSGFRLCLVYNLTLAQSKSKKSVSAPRISEHLDKVRKALSKWQGQDTPRLLAVPLDHQYTEKGLNFDALKGVDRAKARVLVEAASQTGCQAHLALLTFHQTGSAEYSGGGYGRYGRRHYDDDGPHEMGEIIESSLTLDHWRDAEGNEQPLGEITLDEDEFVSMGELTDVEPEEEFEGYTGNAGMTLDRWYRHAVIVLWPMARHFEMLCAAGIDHALLSLRNMVKSKPRGEARDRSLAFARAILAQWPERRYARHYGASAETVDALAVFAALDDLALIRDFLRGPMLKDATLAPAKSLQGVCMKHGWRTFEDELGEVFERSTNETILRNVGVLEAICVGEDNDGDRRNLCARLAGILLSKLGPWDQEGQTRDWQASTVDRSPVLASLLKALIAVEASDLIRQFLEHVRDHPRKYPLITVQLLALHNLDPWLREHGKAVYPALGPWLATLQTDLEDRTRSKPQPPPDWRRPAEVSCTCQYCRELNEFLTDPSESVHRFRVRKELRQHLHQVIERHQCDLTHVTDRRGSPQTLVCTKTDASYRRALKEYEENLEHLRRLRALQEHLARKGMVKRSRS